MKLEGQIKFSEQRKYEKRQKAAYKFKSGNVRSNNRKSGRGRPIQVIEFIEAGSWPPRMNTRIIKHVIL